MKKRQLFCLLMISASLPGCALKQEFHAFPKDAAAMIGSENCDCETVEFIEDNASLVFDQGLVPREKFSGYVLKENGSQQPYSFSKSALYVDKDLNLLHVSGSTGRSTDTADGNTEKFSRKHMTFHNAKQSADLLNPFDGETYTLSGRYDGKSASVVIEKPQNGTTSIVGNIFSTYSANINGHAYQLNVVRQWKAMGEKISVDEDKVWHQYPDGAYIIISKENGVEVKIFQGASIGKIMGMKTFSGDRSVAFFPAELSDDIKRDMFLYYYGIEFFQAFIDDVQMLPDCLNYPEEQSEGECPNNIVIK